MDLEHIVAGTVRMWRGHGLSDEELLAAARRGMAQALAEHEANPHEGLSLELRVAQDAASEIVRSLPAPDRVAALPACGE